MWTWQENAIRGREPRREDGRGKALRFYLESQPRGGPRRRFVSGGKRGLGLRGGDCLASRAAAAPGPSGGEGRGSCWCCGPRPRGPEPGDTAQTGVELCARLFLWTRKGPLQNSRRSPGKIQVSVTAGKGPGQRRKPASPRSGTSAKNVEGALPS